MTPSSAPRPKPCSLVTAAEARTILGGPTVTPVVAPLGPTCIYRSRQHNTMIAVSIENVAWRQLRSTLRGMRKFAISGRRQAYCGGDHSSYELVRLSSTAVLHVVGPCLIASKFADRALTRLTAS